MLVSSSGTRPAANTVGETNRTAATTATASAGVVDNGAAAAADADDVGELIFAHVFFRHGARTPITPYPTDPWRDAKHWPEGWGQLTDVSAKRQYAIATATD